MRLKLTLHCPPNSRLAFEHHHALQAVVYRIIESGNSEFSHWLHESGFETAGKKRFKLFTFGLLTGKPYRRDVARLEIVFPTGLAEWEVSFCVDAQVEHFVAGLFKNQRFDLAAGPTKTVFEVASIEVIPDPVFEETMRFRAETGICIAEQTEADRYPQFRRPDDPSFQTLFFRNLADKYQAASNGRERAGLPDGLDFRLLSEPKKWSTVMPQGPGEIAIRTIGYRCDFEITAPVDWLKVGYAAGFGAKNSGGFGFCSVLT